MTDKISISDAILDTFYEIDEGSAKLRMNLKETRGRELQGRTWTGRYYREPIRLGYTKAKVVSLESGMWLVGYGSGGYGSVWTPGEIVAKPWEFTKEFMEQAERELRYIFTRDVLVSSKRNGIYVFERGNFECIRRRKAGKIQS